MFLFFPFFPIPPIVVEDTSDDTVVCTVVEVEQPRFKDNRFNNQPDTKTEIICKEE